MLKVRPPLFHSYQNGQVLFLISR
uniref:Uncharacterized protein n=1 Tax=Arundo donax TaxID=35708 RepID=A0A0A9AIW2_ARUDO